MLCWTFDSAKLSGRVGVELGACLRKARSAECGANRVKQPRAPRGLES